MGIQEICMVLVTQLFEVGTILYTTKNRQEDKGGTAKRSFLGHNFGFGWILSIHITR